MILGEEKRLNHMGFRLSPFQVKDLSELRQFRGRVYTVGMQNWFGWDFVAMMAGAAVLALWYRMRRSRDNASSGSPRRTLLPLLIAIVLAGIALGLSLRGG